MAKAKAKAQSTKKATAKTKTAAVKKPKKMVYSLAAARPTETPR